MAKKRKKAGKKIIHLSDAHVGYKDLSRKLEDIVTKIIFMKEPASDYVIVHTGDIVENAAKKGSYDKAKAHLNRLKDAGFTVLVVPGNHDYGTGIIANKKYVKRFKDCFYGNTNLNYPKLDVKKNIAFIGLDSMEAEIGTVDRLSAEGELGKPQLKRLAVILKKDKVKKCDYRVLYLHHHPFHYIPNYAIKRFKRVR
ncbi:MAG: metallophosphoesterase family protein [Candidatus Scalinduaceae bacterium]